MPYLSTNSILQLLLGHLRAALDVLSLGAPVEFRLRRAAVANARQRRPAAALGRAPRIFSAHRAAALALSARADMRAAFAFLLVGFAARFLAFCLAQVP